jgi:hypothetical protein
MTLAVDDLHSRRPRRGQEAADEAHRQRERKFA